MKIKSHTLVESPIEYELVIYASFDSDESIDDFVDSVNEKLAAGWRLQGGVACYPIPGCKECIFFAQAIVRDKKDEGDFTASETAALWDFGGKEKKEHERGEHAEDSG